MYPISQFMMAVTVELADLFVSRVMRMRRDGIVDQIRFLFRLCGGKRTQYSKANRGGDGCEVNATTL